MRKTNTFFSGFIQVENYRIRANKFHPNYLLISLIIKKNRRYSKKMNTRMFLYLKLFDFMPKIDKKQKIIN